MFSFIAVAFLFTSVSAFETRYQFAENAINFHDYMRTHDKTYWTEGDEIFAFNAFVKTDQQVKEHNQNPDRTWSKGHNKFSDKFPFELTHLRGLKTNSSFIKKAHLWTTHTYSKYEMDNLPTSVDWRANGYVTPVKNQGQCGSCWAFSSTGSMEGAHARATGNLVSLSEEDLVNCVQDCEGCGGGYMTYALQWVVDHGGVDTEASYPYTPNDGPCLFNKSNVGATFSKVVTIPQGDCAGLLNAVGTVGPVSVAVNANDIINYRTGIFTDNGCDPTALDHGVLVVGYGETTDGHKFWIVKNSWGTDWGQDGYIYWDRNEDDVCGICQAAVYPVV